MLIVLTSPAFSAYGLAAPPSPWFKMQTQLSLFRFTRLG
jgi:hypothetical protein